MNWGLRLPRNQYDSTLACKKQGSPKWHEFKTEEVSKILLQLSCQASQAAPGVIAVHGFSMFSVLPALRMRKVQPYERGSYCLSTQTQEVVTSLAAATVLLFADLEETLIWTTEAVCLAGCLLFICSYFQFLKWLFRWFDLCHQLSQLYDLAFCSLIFTVVH